jgi:hypothetical protein
MWWIGRSVMPVRLAPMLKQCPEGARTNIEVRAGLA